jgi:PelA/Pel-15E family pectate lyase
MKFIYRTLVVVTFLFFNLSNAYAQKEIQTVDTNSIDISGFSDCTHHWYDINDGEQVINPLPNQPRYVPSEIARIADNILLYQKDNGGWAKNYDMLALLTNAQRAAIINAKNTTNTTFDNGATHSHIEYLAQAYTRTKDERYKDACLRGLDFLLSAQYTNGGWPQTYPEIHGYSNYITFNDGAMTGVMTVLQHIINNEPSYAFVDTVRRQKATKAFAKGLECILRCQIIEHGKRTVWCQQHDNIDFHPQDARNFEPACKCSEESADIVLLLMSISHPSDKIIASIQGAVKWYQDSKLHGIRIKTINTPTEKFRYHSVSFDRVVEQDTSAPFIWTRYYELGSNKPIFCNRDKQIVYTLAEVDKERRTGYTWYNYEPQKVLDAYPRWQKQWAPEHNVLQ